MRSNINCYLQFMPVKQTKLKHVWISNFEAPLLGQNVYVQTSKLNKVHLTFWQYWSIMKWISILDERKAWTDAAEKARIPPVPTPSCPSTNARTRARDDAQTRASKAALHPPTTTTTTTFQSGCNVWKSDDDSKSVPAVPATRTVSPVRSDNFNASSASRIATR